MLKRNIGVTLGGALFVVIVGGLGVVLQPGDQGVPRLADGGPDLDVTVSLAAEAGTCAAAFAALSTAQKRRLVGAAICQSDRVSCSDVQFRRVNLPATRWVWSYHPDDRVLAGGAVGQMRYAATQVARLQQEIDELPCWPASLAASPTALNRCLVGDSYTPEQQVFLASCLAALGVRRVGWVEGVKPRVAVAATGFVRWAPDGGVP